MFDEALRSDQFFFSIHIANFCIFHFVFLLFIEDFMEDYLLLLNITPSENKDHY